jgi:Asp-tRNA(Asn)/Glu-tRNA(Gln) amidotransferase A subunit family amidase
MPENTFRRRTFLRYFAAAGLAGTTLPELLWAESSEGAINRPKLEACEVLAGLNFSDRERDLMLADLEQLRNGYKEVRQAGLGPEVAPAFVFRPHRTPVPVSVASVKTPHPLPEQLLRKEEERPFLSIRQLAAGLRSGEYSSQDLTAASLERLEQYGPTLECVITLTKERALEEADRADRELAAGYDRGPLHGLPWGAKDLMAARGYPTTWGAKPFRQQRFDYDATVVERLGAAGAPLAAKLTAGALAWGDAWFGGKTRNPWNLEQGSSGSSAGSASATAAGLVPFSLGTETLGSIVSPCTRCGTTGLRPTFGQVSRHGVMPLTWTMDKVGPICTSVEDCALVLEAIAGGDEKDPSVIGQGFRWDPDVDPTKVRLGYVKSAFEEVRLAEGEVDGEPHEDEEWRQIDLLTLEQLGRMGFDLIPIEFPPLPVDPLLLIISVESAAIFDQLTRTNGDDELVRQIRFAWPNIFRQAHFIPAVEYVQAQRIRTLWMESLDRIFKEVDVYLAPSQSDNLSITNLTGHPQITLPNAFRHDGTPTSITFTGRLFEENTMLAVARAFQEATGFHLRRPPLVQPTHATRS